MTNDNEKDAEFTRILDEIIDQYFAEPNSHLKFLAPWDIDSIIKECEDRLPDPEPKQLSVRGNISGDRLRTYVRYDKKTVAASIANHNNRTQSGKVRESCLLFYMRFPDEMELETEEKLYEFCSSGRGSANRLMRAVECAVEYKCDYYVSIRLFCPQSNYFMRDVVDYLWKNDHFRENALKLTGMRR